MFVPDLDKLRALWGDDPPAESFEDFLTVSIETEGGNQMRSPTHLFGDQVRVIPYHDLDGEETVRDADGLGYTRGDAALAEVFKPGDLGFMMKHRRGEARHGGRRIAAPMTPESAKAHLKLQDTHVGLVIGVADRGGNPGVITVHNPQGYPHNKGRETRIDETWEEKKRVVGRFGEPEYSMVFFRPTFPDYASADVCRSLIDNIRTMGVAFNAVTDYPSENYDGNDPLAATDVGRVREHAAQMVRALAGDEAGRQQALAWFKAADHQLYCSEFAHVATSAGLHCPLNAATFVPLVGEQTWSRFVEMVECHNRGEETSFQSFNKNPLIRHVQLSIAADDLRPLPDYAPESLRAAESEKLAFQPLTAHEIIHHSIAELFRSAGGEDRTGVPEDPPLDAAGLVGHYCPPMLESLSTTDAGGTPTTEQLAGACPRPNQDSSKTLFVPPSLLHFVAKGHCIGGLMGLSYAGHGLHFSLVRPINQQ